MTKRGKAKRAKVGRGKHALLALPVAKMARRASSPPEEPPEVYRPFLDALAELLAAEAIRRSTVSPGPVPTVNPQDPQGDSPAREPQLGGIPRYDTPQSALCRRRRDPSRKQSTPTRTRTRGDSIRIREGGNGEYGAREPQARLARRRCLDLFFMLTLLTV